MIVAHRISWFMLIAGITGLCMTVYAQYNQGRLAYYVSMTSPGNSGAVNSGLLALTPEMNPLAVTLIIHKTYGQKALPANVDSAITFTFSDQMGENIWSQKLDLKQKDGVERSESKKMLSSKETYLVKKFDLRSKSVKQYQLSASMDKALLAVIGNKVVVDIRKEASPPSPYYWAIALFLLFGGIIMLAVTGKRS